MSKLSTKERLESFKKLSVKEKLYIIFIRYQLLFVLLIALDQATKLIVLNTIAKTNDSISIFGDWFKIQFVWNDGVAFSLFSSLPQYFSALISIIATIALEYVLIAKKSEDKILNILLLILAAGALGNGIDRWIAVFGKYEGVIDFLYVTWFANFNVADIYVTCSCIIMVIYLIFAKDDDEPSYKEMREAKKRLKEQNNTSDNEVNPNQEQETANDDSQNQETDNEVTSENDSEKSDSNE